jgi:hypothetical protein
MTRPGRQLRRRRLRALSAAGLAADQAAPYQVQVAGRLGAHWDAALDGLWLTTEVTRDGTSVTTLTGLVPDQAALHDLLAHVRNLNLTLLLVERLPPRPQKDGDRPCR